MADNYIPNIHVMVDLETIGTRPDAVMLSIAGVVFDCEYGEYEFYEKINIDSCLDEGLIIEEDVIKWWSQLPDEVFAEATSGTKPVKQVLQEFSDWMKTLPGIPLVYGNGADFDNAMLSYYFKRFGIEVPWKYTNNRCFRTMKGLFPKVKYVYPEIAHDALSDAKAQAEQATIIYKLIRSFNRDLELVGLLSELTDEDLEQLKFIIKDVLGMEG